jgi:hypothetical protein
LRLETAKNLFRKNFQKDFGERKNGITFATLFARGKPRGRPKGRGTRKEIETSSLKILRR